MSSELRTRINAQGVVDLTASVGEAIVCSRDVVDLTMSIRAPDGKTLQQVLVDQTLAASATLDLDLNSSSNTLKDAFNRPVQIEKLHWLLITVIDQATTKALRYGPSGASGSGQWWYSGTAADRQITVADTDVKFFRAGLTVTPGSSILRIVNPSAVAVRFRLWALGIQA